MCFQKIISSAYYNRIKPMLAYIISSAQTGFVPASTIFKNIILTNDTIDWCKIDCPEAILLSLEFAKAYDWVQWNSLLKNIQKMCFGSFFQTIILSWYYTRCAALAINGLTIIPFMVSKEVRQGDSTSLFAFVAQMSHLFEMMVSCRFFYSIKLSFGVTLPGGSIIADDCLLLAQ